MKKKLLIKMLAIGVIILFAGASVVSSINDGLDNHEIESTEITDRIENINRGKEIFNPIDDAYTNQRQPSTLHGSKNMMEVATWDGFGSSNDWERDALIKFDLSSIPSGSSIISATLYLYYYDNDDNNPAGRTLTCYRITSNWNEETVTWNTRPSHHSVVCDSDIVPNSHGIWMDWDVTDDVQDIVDGVNTNYGWQIMDEGTWNSPDIPVPRFRAKEHESLMSYLEIEVFEPTKAILIGKVTNVDTSSEGFIRFNAEFLRFIQLSPFSFNRYTLGEEILVSDSYRGLLTTKFALGLFDAELWE